MIVLDDGGDDNDDVDDDVDVDNYDMHHQPGTVSSNTEKKDVHGPPCHGPTIICKKQ